MKKLLLFILPVCVFSKDVSIGSWKNYLSYNSGSFLCEANDKIYCVASNGLYYVDKEESTINRLSKTTGLSDISVNKIAYNEELNVLIVVYNNCNIDLIKNGVITNISDIKRKEIAGIKEIKNIDLNGNIAYLSSTFGLILLDLEKKEIKDTYNIGDSNGLYDVNACSFLGDSIYAATTNGVFVAYLNSPLLSDYNNWSKLNINETRYDDLLVFNNQLVGDFFDSVVSISSNNERLLTVEKEKIIISSANQGDDILASDYFISLKYAIIDSEEKIWIADSVNGLLKFTYNEFEARLVPEGPVRNEIYSLEFQEEKLYQCHGGHANFGINALINDGVSVKNKYDEWVNFDRYDLGNCRDVLEVAVYKGSEFYASWYHGISEMKDGTHVTKYGFANTGGALDTTYYSNNRIRISDIKFDDNGNMWALSSEVNHPLAVKTRQGDWYSFNIGLNQVDLFLDDLLIDDYNQKWGVLARGNGLFVYNDNNTISDLSDDEYKKINTSVGSGNLPSMQTYCVEKDFNGEVWVGTDKGVAVFYNPEAVFTGFNFDSEQILITEGDYGQYLLSEERVKCIYIDGANRKWIGTEKSGIFLLSENGQEEILHFTEENSPLLSNNIVDITMNNESGEVFIGTSKGLISYRSDATKGVTTQSSTEVFPNPVHENYYGPIAIRGLINNAFVKITDIAGDIVYQTTANGGQAIWNGLNKNNEKASTGVYLVFSTDELGNETMVSKILLIK